MVIANGQIEQFIESTDIYMKIVIVLICVIATTVFIAMPIIVVRLGIIVKELKKISKLLEDKHG